MSFRMFVYKQEIMSCYSVKSSLFLPDCGKAPPMWAMPWSAPETLLHSDSWGSFRISGWSASSPLRFTWYLIDAVSSFGPSLRLCMIRVAQKFGPPPFSYYRQTWDGVGQTPLDADPPVARPGGVGQTPPPADADPLRQSPLDADPPPRQSPPPPRIHQH